MQISTDIINGVLPFFISVFFIFGFFPSLLILYSYEHLKSHHVAFKKYYGYVVAINIVSIVSFALVLEGVIGNRWLKNIDISVAGFFAGIQNQALTQVMIVITHIGDPLTLFVLSFVLVGYLFYKRSWYKGVLATAALATGGLLDRFIKLITDITRPGEPLVRTFYASFPSGHTTMITIFCILLAWAFGDKFKNMLSRNVFYSVLAIIIFLVALSRIYLRAHWLSDVIGGLALGIFSTTFFMIFLHSVMWRHSSLKKSK